MDNKQKQLLWKTADQLRSNMDAAEYKHVVLGLIFLKYISDSFDAHRQTLLSDFANPNSEYYLADVSEYEAELEDRDYYVAQNVFWVPETARWEYIRDKAQQPDIGRIIDDAMIAIEKENPKLKNILNKSYSRIALPSSKIAELINTISSVGFGEDKIKAKDVLGEVYEYFLGMFASAEGKRGGQFYTPASIVKTLVAVMAPHKGRLYDPCCGSGGMFVQSEKFLQKHNESISNISIYGQESNPTTWRLAAMNLAIRGIDFDLGKEPADTFSRDQHKDLKADYILANPPFNISDWGGEHLADDARWQYGKPPTSNANYAWIQHMISHLAPTGVAGIVLANGSMSSNTGGEGEIRKALIEADLVECMVALPSQLFFNTQIPACLWFLRKQKKRKGQVLFIDARDLGRMEDRVNRVFEDADIAKIADTYHLWRLDEDAPKSKDYSDIKGFCKSANLDELKANDYVLTPGRYVGIEETEDNEEEFAEKMEQLVSDLKSQMQKATELDQEIKKNLTNLGWEI